VTTGVADSRTAPLVADLVAIARPEQWSKHIFIVPGLLVGLALTGSSFSLPVVAGGLLSACLLASANYVMNEWLDASFDSHHPIKGARPAAMGRLTPRLVYAEYVVLVLAGLALAAMLSSAFFATAVLFLIGAVVYNVRPLRAKERVHLDIIVEAANNPMRLLFGWFMAAPASLPPLSLLIMYWCSGAFLMATKRLAEYRYLVEWSGPELAARYRRSFHGYDQTSLILTCFLYAILASFSLAIFLIKYRAELVLAVPLFAWIFIHYLRVAMQERTLAESPEKFYRQRGLLPLLLILVAALTVLSMVDIPWVRDLAQKRFTAIELRR
jgi:4-hydroxybenzoate polyprenyltransferase